MSKQVRSDVVYGGWLDRKGTSLINPWSPRWVVLTLDDVRVYKDQGMNELKAEMSIDESTRVIFVEQIVGGSYRFCVCNLKDCLEFSVQDIDLRNMWLQKFVYVTEKKSELGGHVMRVGSESDIRNVRQWERAVVADSIDKSTGVMVFQSVSSDVFSSSLVGPGPVKQQKHLAVVSEDDPHFASFYPFDNWQVVFEPEVRAAQEQARKNEELRKQGYKIPDPSTMDRVRDYMVDTIVTNITTSSTTSFCCSLLEGMVQLIAASERQLARKYHLASATNQNLAIISSTDSYNKGMNPVGHSLPKDVPPIASSVKDIQDASLLVVTDPPTDGVHLPKEDVEIPLSVQADLLCALGSLRGLILTYRFDNNPARDAQVRFTRRLCVHQLERSLSKVLQSLEDLQKEEFEKAAHAVVDTAGKTSAHAAVHKVEKRLAEKAVDRLDTATAKMITPTPPKPDEHSKQGGEEQRGEQGEGEGEQDERGQEAEDKDMPSEQDTAYERGIKVRRASLKQFRAILRPLLSREFLQVEAAPLLQDFMKRNDMKLKELEGLAKEVTATFGDAMQKFVEKKVNEMEEMVVTHMEALMGTISEHSEHVPTSDELAETLKSKMKVGAKKAVGTLDEPSLQEESPPAFPQSSHEVMVKLAQEKAALDRKIAQIKTEGSVLWDGSEKSLVEMVLLEKTDALWVQLQDAVRMCINKGLWALLDLTGAGLHPTNSPSAPSPPPPPPAPPASSGYFF